MSRTNTTVKNPSILNRVLTHPGALARVDRPFGELQRAVFGCFLWEDQFYESGEDAATRIQSLAVKVKPEQLAQLAVEARHDHHLRHVPLLLLCMLAKTGTGIPHLVQDTVTRVVNRPDEMGELLSLYWKLNPRSDGKKAPIPAQFKKGLRRALTKFDTYQISKYNRDSAIKIRDIAFLTHPEPETKEQALTWAKAFNKDHFPEKINIFLPNMKDEVFEKLAPAETWEVALSAGADKKETFEQKLRDGKLGYMALLKNLRGMIDAKVDETLIREALIARKGAHNVLPFRFITAAKYAPRLEDAIDQAFLANLMEAPKLPGKTVAIIDVSGSMHAGAVSKGSELSRLDAAAALGAILREVCEVPAVYATAGNDGRRVHQTALVPPRHGLPLVEAIKKMTTPLGGGGIFLKQVMDFVYDKEGNVDRVIVITDEQDCDNGSANSPLNARRIGENNYIINVSSYKQAITYDSWTRISGFSESIVKYIQAVENIGEWE